MTVSAVLETKKPERRDSAGKQTPLNVLYRLCSQAPYTRVVFALFVKGYGKPVCIVFEPVGARLWPSPGNSDLQAPNARLF